MAFVTVARVDELYPGKIIPVEIGDTEMIVYQVEDRYYAAERYCIHRGADMRYAGIEDGLLTCKLHGWRFHPDSGVHELSPFTCLTTYAVRVDDDRIQVDPTPIRAVSDRSEP